MKHLLIAITMLLSFQMVMAQTRITGKVTDESGLGIPGVTVLVKGTQSVTITDIDGNYSIELPDEGEILVFSSVGYKKIEVEIDGRTIIDTVFETDVLDIEEVVVVGYGSQKKANLTGAVSSVDVGGTLEARPITDVGRGLQGATSGLTIMTTTGDIGVSPSIYLRGINGSLNTEAQPLILVDNVEVPDLSLINPDDIESISVLKDAASSSIYGSRGAWGVILIKTKDGNRDGKTTITYSNNFSWSTPTDIPISASTFEGAKMTLAANQRINPNITSFGTLGMYVDEEAITKMEEWENLYGGQDLGMEMVLGRDFEERDGKYYFYRSWDVRDLFLKKWTPQENHNVNISGGNEKTSYNISLGYMGQKGSLKVKEDVSKRFNASLSITSQLKKWLSVHAKGIITRSSLETPFQYSGIKNDMWYYLLRWPRYYPYGTYEGKPFRSAITEMEQANMCEKEENFYRINVGTTLDIIKGLTVTADYTYDITNRQSYEPGGSVSAYNFWTGGGVDGTYGSYTSSSYDMVYYGSGKKEQNTAKIYATYLKDIKDHSFKIMAGSDVESYEYWFHSSERNELIDEDMAEISLATGEQYVEGERLHWSTMGFFGRVNYDYKDRYLLEINGRYDGSSHFPSSDRWAFFPSVSVGYRITEEEFMSFAKPYLTSLKLRGSWGSIGNHNVGENTFVSTMPSEDSNWLIDGNNMLTVETPKVVSSSLTWETVTTIDFGLDARLFDEVGVTFDWYRRTTSDMVTSGEAVPNTFGADAPQMNFGELQTTGYEISIDWYHRFKNGLMISATAMFFDYKEKITKFDSDSKSIYDYYEGRELGEIWGYETDRFFAESDFQSDGTLNEGIPSQSIFEDSWFIYGPGDIKYKDLDGSGVIDYGSNTVDDHGDLKVIGNSTPRYQYSLRLGAEWKGVDFSIFFQGVGKRDYWATGPVFIPGYVYGEAWYEHQQDYWTPENQDAFYPRPTSHSWTNNARNFLRQSKYLMDMSYLRCKNITLGYTLPVKLLNRIGIEKFRVYFSGENLFEFTNLKLPIDPETGLRDDKAYDFSFGRSYPYRRTISFGLQLSL